MIAEPCHICGTVTVCTVHECILDYEYHMCRSCQWLDWISLTKYGQPYYVPSRQRNNVVFPTFH